MQALQRIQVAIPTLQALSLALLLGAGIALGRGVPVLSASVAGAGVGALLGVKVVQFLEGFKRKFIFEDYVHAFKD